MSGTTVEVRADAPERALRAALFVLGGTSVASLLAWVMGIGGFDTTFLVVSVPGQVALVVIGIVAARRSVPLRTLVLAGAIGGLLGTFAYDVVRVPFAIAGHRVLAPIDSYGVLAAGASGSSAWTGLLGWGYHFANGVGFGIAYAMLAPRRHWAWGVAWGLLLETVTVLTPFATTYGLVGGADGTNWFALAVAYGAHVPYGMAVGLVVQHRDRVVRTAAPPGSATVPIVFGLVAAALLQWQAPWRATLANEGADVAPGASAVVVDGRFHPEWLRVGAGACATFANRDTTTWTIDVDGEARALPPGSTRVCFIDEGVHRVRTSDEPYAGGFVIVDPFG